MSVFIRYTGLVRLERTLKALSKPHVLLFLVTLCVEVGIALFAHDRFLRPYGGDALVVVLVYALVRSFFVVTPVQGAVGSFLFACLVEGAQYLELVSVLGLSRSNIARTVIGTHADLKDILAYAIGAALVLLFELCLQRYPTSVAVRE